MQSILKWYNNCVGKKVLSSYWLGQLSFAPKLVSLRMKAGYIFSFVLFVFERVLEGRTFVATYRLRRGNVWILLRAAVKPSMAA